MAKNLSTLFTVNMPDALHRRGSFFLDLCIKILEVIATGIRTVQKQPFSHWLTSAQNKKNILNSLCTLTLNTQQHKYVFPFSENNFL